MEKTEEQRRTERRVKAVAIKLEEMVRWYIANNSGVGPKQVVEDKPNHTACVVRWLDPPLPHLDNPMLVERYVGDFWTIELVKRPL